MLNPQNITFRSGGFRDYTTNYLITVWNVNDGSWLKSFLGMILGLCGAYISYLTKKAFMWWWDRSENHYNLASSTDNSQQQNGGTNLSNPTAAARATIVNATTLAPIDSVRIIKQESSKRKMPFYFVRLARRPNVVHRASGLCYIGLSFVLFCGWAVSGIFLTALLHRGDNIALWNSGDSGVWNVPEDLSDDNDKIRARRFDLLKETRAAEYARDCYDLPHSISELSFSHDCDYFYKQQIHIDRNPKYGCPFDKSICKSNRYVSFDTGFRDASELGINAKNSWKFRRTANCAVLNSNAPFVEEEEEEEEEEKEGKGENHRLESRTFRYNYGPFHSQEYTDKSSGYPFSWLVPMYDLRAFIAWGNGSKDSWKPRSELVAQNASEESSISLLFLNILHIYFAGSTDDPLFYTDTNWQGGHYKNEPERRAVACVENTQICETPEATNCWFFEKDKDRKDLPKHVYLLKAALDYSSVYFSISLRLGRGLIAQTWVNQFRSQAIPSEHWMDEMYSLFATSLARAQWDAWSITSGEGRKYADDLRLVPDPKQKVLTTLDFDIFKFRQTGFETLSIGWIVGLFIPIPLLCLVVFELIIPILKMKKEPEDPFTRVPCTTCGK